MKDCVWGRGILYFLIAALATFIPAISQYKTLSDIGDIAKIVLISNVLLQGFIAVRAFVDQSISRAADKKNTVSKRELIIEDKKII
jgi:hypothetical protein